MIPGEKLAVAKYIREPYRGLAFEKSITLISGCSVSWLLKAL